MNEEQVKVVVEKALKSLITEQRDLILLDATERAISHFLAIYIMDLVPQCYNVDVEYNRDGYDPKRLSIHPESVSSDAERAVTVYPDIIVHKRNNADHNLLVLEMKKPGGDMACDERKLRGFLGELRYKFAAHVIVGVEQGRVVGYPKWIESEPSLRGETA